MAMLAPLIHQATEEPSSALPRLTPEDLIAFEKRIADIYNTGKIRAPVHLAGGNEKVLIEFFKDVSPDDWVFTTWRSHYHCLLKGVPADELEADIVAGRSITLNYRQQRIVSSAIVGGVLPIAVGVAWSIKRLGGSNKVWVFLGDMTERTGIFTECARYASGHALPIMFIIENNEKSVCTTTRHVWGQHRTGVTRHYTYHLPWPHAGAGQRVNF